MQVFYWTLKNSSAIATLLLRQKYRINHVDDTIGLCAMVINRYGIDLKRFQDRKKK